MLCLVARHQDDVRRFPLPAGAATIGKSDENDIVLPWLGVSRRHALLTRTDGGLVLTDAGSKNGLVANGTRVASLVLEAGRPVQVGSSLLMLEDADTDELVVAADIRSARARDSRSDATDTLLGRSTEADALSLVGRIERLGAARQNAQWVVVELRRVLGATTVAWLEERGGDPAVAAQSGATLPVAVSIDAAQRVRKEQQLAEDIRRIGDATVLTSGIARGDRASMLIARFEGSPRAITVAERSLFAYVASKLLTARRAEPSTTAPVVMTSKQEIVYESRQMQTLLEAVAAIARSERPILVHGETGSGKELIARLLHESGPYSRGRFLAVNCAEIPKDLLESELFGVERGVATGVEPRIGLFAAADGGTLFLDEIGELPQATQASLLRVLERREVRAVGSRVSKPIRLRVVLGTRRGIAADRDSIALRDDLFYRCLFLAIPPLRERPADITPLALHFLERTCRQAGLERVAISEKAMSLLLRHEWPGNVRELEHAMEEAVLRFGRSGVLQSEQIATVLHTAGAHPVTRPSASLQEEHDLLARERVEGALRQTHGNKAAAARLLGLSRNGLAKMMARLGIGDQGAH